MNKSIALLVILGMAAASATAEAGWIGKFPGSGSLFGQMNVTPTMPSVTAPQEPCFRFAYTAENRDGSQDLFSAGNCLSESKNLTHSSVPVSHLVAGRSSPDLAFLQPLDPSEAPVMNLMNLIRDSWNLFEAGTGFPEHFSPKAVAWDASGRMAVISREKRACRDAEECDESGERDGGFALRINEGPNDYIGDTNLVQPLDMVPPQDMEWVPAPGQPHSRYLIVSSGSSPATTSLYVLDTEASPVLPVPLEETAAGGPFQDAMIGSQPAMGILGESLLLVRGGRILSCNLDLSHMDDASPRAYCPNAWEPMSLRDLPGDMASPSVTPDDQWLFFSMKRPATSFDPAPSWEIYRIRFDRFDLHQLTATPNVDEKEIVSLPNWVEYTPMTVQRATMTIKEEPQYHAVTTMRSTYQAARP